MPVNIVSSALTDPAFGSGIPAYVFIIIAAVVLIACVIVIIAVSKAGTKKAKKKAKKITDEAEQTAPIDEAAPEAQPVPAENVPDVTSTSGENEEVNLSTLPEDAPIEEAPVPEAAAPAEEVKAEEPAPQPEPEPAPEPQPEPQPEPLPESQPAEEPAPAQGPVAAETEPAAAVAEAPAEEAKQDAVVVAPAKPKRVPPVRTKKDAAAPAKKPAPAKQEPKKAEETPTAGNVTVLFDAPATDGPKGKYVIIKDDGNPMRPYKFQLKANNGQVLYESEGYKIKPKAKQIEAFRNTINNGTSVIDEEKNGTFRYKLFKADGITLYGVGEGYKSKAAAESAVESVKYFCNASNTLEDTTVEA